MPIYEYKCKDCSTQFELIGSFGDNPESPCPTCQGKARRVFSAVPVIFKGSGFYITDSQKNGSKVEEPKGASSS